MHPLLRSAPHLADLINKVSGSKVFVWVRYPEGCLRFANLESCGQHPVDNAYPEWWQEEGWDILTSELPILARDIRSFLLREGMAPGQAFLVEMNCPVSVCSETQDGTEWDVEVDWAIVAKEPLTDAEAAARWATSLRQTAETALEVAAYWRRRNDAHLCSRNLFITLEFYQGSRGPYGPDAAVFRVWSIVKEEDVTHRKIIAQGRDDLGDKEAALLRAKLNLQAIPTMFDVCFEDIPRRRLW